LEVELDLSEYNSALAAYCGFFMRITLALHYVGLGEAVARLAGSVVPVDQPYSVWHHV
jgi:hypothetical protein